MSQSRWSRPVEQAIRIAWALFFITLPVTSFPFFPGGLGGRTLVRPLSMYPLVVLLLLLIIPHLLKRPLPRTFLPVLAFTVAALASTIFALTSDLEALRGVTPLSRLVRNLFTLALGLSFYFTATLLHKNWDDLSFSLRWLYAGLAAALLWGTAQIPIVLFNHPVYYRLVNFIQGFISTRKLFTTRISGLTYEPKWFAEQICFLLLPWLIASIITRRTSFPWRWRAVTVEWLLLLWAVVVLVFTYSRTGLFILAVLVLIGFLFYSTYYQHRKTRAVRKTRRRRVMEALTIFLVLVAGLYLVGSQNPYFSRLWRYWTEAKTRNKTYLEFIAFEQRFVYLETALRIFDAYPWLGVGLGNYAFYFNKMLPDEPWNQQKEIVRQITPGVGNDRLITPKNLYARLIAETGLFGTAAFTTFVVAIIGCALFLWFSPSPEQRFWGLSAFLALIVFGFVVFSFDSFALPNMWVVFGLITAAAHLADPAGSPDASTLEKPA